MNNKRGFLLFTVLFFALSANAQTLMNADYMLPTLYHDDGDGFIVIAHRGASAYYPENTMPAFRGAVEMEAEMIELDIMLSKDGIPVVFHDAKLEAHTNGTGKLKEYTLEELQKLDAGSWFDPKFSGQRIPTLDEVLAFASGTVALNIEIKTEAVTDEVNGGVEEKCLRLVRKHGMENHVLFSSFDYRAIAHLKELDPRIPAAILYEKSQSKGMLPSELLRVYKADAFNCSFQQLNRKRLQDTRRHDIPVFVYTINDKKRMRQLIERGTRGIFTDKPDVLWQVLENSGHK